MTEPRRGRDLPGGLVWIATPTDLAATFALPETPPTPIHGARAEG